MPDESEARDNFPEGCIARATSFSLQTDLREFGRPRGRAAAGALVAAEGVQGSPVLRTPHDDRFVFAASQEVRAAPELRARYCACSTCADVRGPMAVQCAVPRRERTLVLLECAELAPPFEIVHQHPLILRDESGGGSAADA
eukprot:COSAG04_NODE_12179_length_666_cov_1.400353_2_plen_141_part_01